MLGVKVYELVALAEGLTPAALIPGGFDPDEEVIISYFRKMPVDERELFKAIGASFSKLRRTKSLADTR